MWAFSVVSQGRLWLLFSSFVVYHFARQTCSSFCMIFVIAKRFCRKIYLIFYFLQNLYSVFLGHSSTGFVSGDYLIKIHSVCSRFFCAADTMKNTHKSAPHPHTHTHTLSQCAHWHFLSTQKAFSVFFSTTLQCKAIWIQAVVVAAVCCVCVCVSGAISKSQLGDFELMTFKQSAQQTTEPGSRDRKRGSERETEEERVRNTHKIKSN